LLINETASLFLVTLVLVGVGVGVGVGSREGLALDFAGRFGVVACGWGLLVGLGLRVVGCSVLGAGGMWICVGLVVWNMRILTAFTTSDHLTHSLYLLCRRLAHPCTKLL